MSGHETKRMTARRRSEFGDDLFDALVALEKLRNTCPWIDEPPFLLDGLCTAIDLGALLAERPSTRRPPSKMVTMTRSAEAKAWSVQRWDFPTPIPGGVRGRLRVVTVGERDHKGGVALDIRWMPGKLQARREDAGWKDATGFWLPPVDLVEERKVHASVFFGIDKMAVELLANWAMVRRLLSDRETATDRRAALRHLVDNFFRGPSRDDDEVWVRKHLRGKTGCQWGPFEVLIRVPEAVAEDVRTTKEMRDVYSKLPPEERAEWRALVKETFRPKEVLA